jgi:hypothetical protein
MTEIDLIWLMHLIWLANEVVNGALLDALLCTTGIAVAFGFFTGDP